jgi:D-alanyl-lipoteichoic acid acyltransferase DltB (MBOAT superfamily)
MLFFLERRIMLTTMRLLRTLLSLLTLSVFGLALSFAPLVPPAFAQGVFDGGGLAEGLLFILGIKGPIHGDLRSIIIAIVTFVLGFLGLIAVISIIIGGIYLVVGMGSDESRAKAKTIILYTVIGLLVVLFARLMVETVISVAN